MTDRQFDVDATPDVNEIDRTPAADRPNRIPSLNAVQWDNKKMIIGAALGGAAIFTILTLITGSGGDSQAIQAKRKAPPAAAEAPYDPNTVIAPTLVDRRPGYRRRQSHRPAFRALSRRRP